jgi:hypothetical protein
MTEAEGIAESIGRALPEVKSGTLRFWGQWFGRPYDNCHRIVACEAASEVLRVRFTEGEVLSVWAPRGATIDANTFRIADAARVRWEWFSYGRPKTAENLYFEEFVKDGHVVSAATNVDWRTPKLRPDPSHPAVEIL